MRSTKEGKIFTDLSGKMSGNSIIHIKIVPSPSQLCFVIFLIFVPGLFSSRNLRQQKNREIYPPVLVFFTISNLIIMFKISAMFKIHVWMFPFYLPTDFCYVQDWEQQGSSSNTWLPFGALQGNHKFPKWCPTWGNMSITGSCVFSALDLESLGLFGSLV